MTTERPFGGGFGGEDRAEDFLREHLGTDSSRIAGSSWERSLDWSGPVWLAP